MPRYTIDVLEVVTNCKNNLKNIFKDFDKYAPMITPHDPNFSKNKIDLKVKFEKIDPAIKELELKIQELLTEAIKHSLKKDGRKYYENCLKKYLYDPLKKLILEPEKENSTIENLIEKNFMKDERHQLCVMVRANLKSQIDLASRKPSTYIRDSNPPRHYGPSSPADLQTLRDDLLHFFKIKDPYSTKEDLDKIKLYENIADEMLNLFEKDLKLHERLQHSSPEPIPELLFNSAEEMYKYAVNLILFTKNSNGTKKYNLRMAEIENVLVQIKYCIHRYYKLKEQNAVKSSVEAVASSSNDSHFAPPAAAPKDPISLAFIPPRRRGREESPSAPLHGPLRTSGIVDLRHIGPAALGMVGDPGLPPLGPTARREHSASASRLQRDHNPAEKVGGSRERDLLSSPPAAPRDPLSSAFSFHALIPPGRRVREEFPSTPLRGPLRASGTVDLTHIGPAALGMGGDLRRPVGPAALGAMGGDLRRPVETTVRRGHSASAVRPSRDHNPAAMKEERRREPLVAPPHLRHVLPPSSSGGEIRGAASSRGVTPPGRASSVGRRGKEVAVASPGADRVQLNPVFFEPSQCSDQHIAKKVNDIKELAKSITPPPIPEGITTDQVDMILKTKTVSPSPQSTLSFTCVEKDSFVAAKALTSETSKRPLVMNLANKNTAGGGWETGANAQEECLFYNSNLFYSLYYFADKYRNGNGRFYYRGGPIPHCKTIYCPEITVLRDSQEPPQDLPPEQRFQVDVLTIAGYDLGGKYKMDLLARANPEEEKLSRAYLNDRSKRDPNFPELAQEFKQLTKEKIKLSLKVAAAKGNDVLVLGAISCGAFMFRLEDVSIEPEWTVKLVTAAYKEAFQELQKENPEVLAGFKHIQFAVIDKHKDNPKFVRNYDHFNRLALELQQMFAQPAATPALPPDKRGRMHQP